jgi:hypothetical protein
MLIAHQAESVELDFPLGTTLQDVRETLKHVLNVPPDAGARVNGQQVGGDHVVGATDEVEFVKERGHKGVGDHVWTAEEFCQFFNLTERELRDQIQRGLRVMELANGSMRITETAADEFIRGMNGGVGSTVLADIAASLKRIADHVDPPPPDVVDTTYIANKLGCTKVWVAQMALDKLIPPSCILPGTGNGKPWKFYRTRIDKWIEMR